MTNQNPEKRTVLVVDDEEYIRDLVRTALSFSGFEVAVAGDGITALNDVQRLRPDLVILDVNMPGFDGFEVVRRLRDAGDATPVIFLTARAETRELDEYRTLGPLGIIIKPFDPITLADTVRRMWAGEEG